MKIMGRIIIPVVGVVEEERRGGKDTNTMTENVGITEDQEESLNQHRVTYIPKTACINLNALAGPEPLGEACAPISGAMLVRAIYEMELRSRKPPRQQDK